MYCTIVVLAYTDVIIATVFDDQFFVTPKYSILIGIPSNFLHNINIYLVCSFLTIFDETLY